jgi:adenosylcobinamide-GDP ribazoletransferase
MPAWFAIVGALVGLVAGAVRVAFDSLLGPLPASALAVVALVAVTGALHEDGLADCADGIGVRGDRGRRLAVMREPQVGVFGVLAVSLWLLLMVSALSGLERGDALRALVVACVLGRWGALLQGVLAAPARADGLGAAFRVGGAQFALASVSGATLVFVVERPSAGAAAIAAALVTSLAMTAWAQRSIGGRTGDTLGAGVALVEVAVCLTVLGFG